MPTMTAIRRARRFTSQSYTIRTSSCPSGRWPTRGRTSVWFYAIELRRNAGQAEVREGRALVDARRDREDDAVFFVEPACCLVSTLSALAPFVLDLWIEREPALLHHRFAVEGDHLRG